MKNKRKTLCWAFCLWGITVAFPQNDVTNAFDDLKRQGAVIEEQSEMRVVASDDAMQALMKRLPANGYFCFLEDRAHDIRLPKQLPARWLERDGAEKAILQGVAQPGEFFTYQIGVYAASADLEGLNVQYTTLKNEFGEILSPAAMRCFNLGGVDTHGEQFRKMVNVPKGSIQPLWIGVDLPATAKGTYKGFVTVKPSNAASTQLPVTIKVEGEAVLNHGDNEGWRKSRLRWLDSQVGTDNQPTAPYIPLKVERNSINYLGGSVELGINGLPKSVITHYDQSNNLDTSFNNKVLADAIRLVIEGKGGVEKIDYNGVRWVNRSNDRAEWKTEGCNRNFEVQIAGVFEFDGSATVDVKVTARNPQQVKDIRLDAPYSKEASKYFMGLGREGGLMPEKPIEWRWDTLKHQDKVWIGGVNAGLNLRFMDDHFNRPLVNIYYALGRLNMPKSWGNRGKGGITISGKDDGGCLLSAYSGERDMQKGEALHYRFDMLITPVKPIDLAAHATERIYHSNSDLSAKYIPEAKEAGAKYITIHHKKDNYPYINYPYHDQSVGSLKKFVDEAHREELKVRLYYTTRELTVKIPELWALRSLGDEVIHDGPGKDARTLIHSNGPNEWLNRNLEYHFIPAWFNAFNEGPYKGEMDISVITTPDSRWNNYYLAGLQWMVDQVGIDGIYIDDSALDRETLKRARRILDADGKRRLIDIHSWNHNNQWAGYANSLHIYMDLLPYVDRTWIGEGFGDYHSKDFWMVEMSGIPFGLMSEMLDARNQFRGMVYGMLPRLPWSGNPRYLWQLWEQFGMAEAKLRGYWDERSPVKSNNEEVPATVYLKGDKALVVVANWTDMPQKVRFKLDESLLGFKPSRISLPEVRNLQWGQAGFNINGEHQLMGRSGLFILIEK